LVGDPKGQFTGATMFTWECEGTGDNNNAYCSAYRSFDGVCGSSDGQTFTSTPTSSLCSAGTTGSVTNTSSGFSWTCFGQYGGNDDFCFAYLQGNLSVGDASVSE